MEKKRVVVVATGLSNGGAERVSAILSSKLANRGYAVLFIALYNAERLYDLSNDVEYKYIDAKGNKIIKYFERSVLLRKEIKDFGADYVYLFPVQEALFALYTCKCFFISSERTDPAKKPINIKIASLLAYRKSKAVVFQTEAQQKYYSTFIQKRGKIIGNPIDMRMPYWLEKPHKQVIVTACRISAIKNLEMLINAFAQLKNQEDYQLHIYGSTSDEQYKKKLENVISGLGLEASIVFKGFVKDVQEKLAEAEIFVLTSNYEGLSNSMLEALCIGVPTICTDCPIGGASTYIEDGKNGFLVPVDDVEMLAKKMQILLDDKSIGVSMSKEAIKLRKELDTERIIDEWEGIMK